MDNFCKLIVYDTTPLIDSVILKDSMEYVQKNTPNAEIIDVHVKKDLWKIIVLKPVKIQVDEVRDLPELDKKLGIERKEDGEA